MRFHERLLFRRSKGWFTGCNSNLAGHGEGTTRYQAYFGGSIRYTAKVTELAANGYPGLTMT